MVLNQDSPRIVLMDSETRRDKGYSGERGSNYAKITLGIYFDSEYEFRELLRHLTDAK